MLKKILIIISVVALLSSCKKESSNVSVQKIFDEITIEMNISKTDLKDLNILEYAKEYGLSPENIKEGYALINRNPEVTDGIILVQAKTADDVEKIENALSNILSGLKNTFDNNEDEIQKLEKSIIKTLDDCVILIIDDEAKKIEKIFDDMV